MLPPGRLPALLASAAVAFLVRRDRPVPLASYFPEPGGSQPRFDDGFFPAFRAFCAARSPVRRVDPMAQRPSCLTARTSPGHGDKISAAAIQRGGARPANDTWIAACVLSYGLPLATLNVKDFKDFAEHEGLAVISPAG